MQMLEWPQVSEPKQGTVCINAGNCGIYFDSTSMVSCKIGEGVQIVPIEPNMIFVTQP